MSHQDRNLKEECLNAHCLKKALRWLFQGMDWTAIQFRKDCSWMPATFAAMALLFVWSGETVLMDRFRRALRIVDFLFPEGHTKKQASKKGPASRRQQKPSRGTKTRNQRKRLSATYQAFTKLLRKWTSTYVALFQVELRRRMPQLFADCLLIYGFLVFGCDGSRVDLPRTHSNEKAYAPSRKKISGQTPRAKRKRKRARRRQRRLAEQQPHSRKTDVPQLWLTLMFHLGTGLPWDWRIGPSDSSERAHMLEMLATLPAQAMVTADAGFVGYEYLSAIQASGRSLLIRVGSNVRLLRKLGRTQESRNRVYLWPDKTANQGRNPLVLRLVVAHNGRHPVYLVTNVLSEKRLTDSQVVKIYAKRWRLEVHYRHLKQTYQKRKLRSHRSENARAELEWSLLGLWTMLLYTLVEVRKTGADPGKLSCAVAWREIKDTMNDYRQLTEPGERLQQRLQCAVTDDYQRRDKTSRDYCRKKHEQPAGAPRISVATKLQIMLAAKLCIENAKKGLTA